MKLYGRHQQEGPEFARIGHYNTRQIEWVMSKEIARYCPVNAVLTFTYEVFKNLGEEGEWRRSYYYVRGEQYTKALRFLIRGSHNRKLPLDFEYSGEFHQVKIFVRKGVSNKGKLRRDGNRVSPTHRVGIVCPLCSREIPAGRIASHFRSKDHIEAIGREYLDSALKHVADLFDTHEEQEKVFKSHYYAIRSLGYIKLEADWLASQTGEHT